MRVVIFLLLLSSQIPDLIATSDPNSPTQIAAQGLGLAIRTVTMANVAKRFNVPLAGVPKATGNSASRPIPYVTRRTR